MGTAAQIRSFRVKAGKSRAEVAQHLGINAAWYDDLEQYDDELVSTLTLFQAMNLAELLGVRLSDLVETAACSSGQHISLVTLPSRIRAYATQNGISIEQLADQVGWELDEVMDSPLKGAAEHPIIFLQTLAGQLGINWMCLIPPENTP